MDYERISGGGSPSNHHVLVFPTVTNLGFFFHAFDLWSAWGARHSVSTQLSGRYIPMYSGTPGPMVLKASIYSRVYDIYCTAPELWLRAVERTGQVTIKTVPVYKTHNHA